MVLELESDEVVFDVEDDSDEDESDDDEEVVDDAFDGSAGLLEPAPLVELARLSVR